MIFVVTILCLNHRVSSWKPIIADSCRVFKIIHIFNEENWAIPNKSCCPFGDQDLKEPSLSAATVSLTVL